MGTTSNRSYRYPESTDNTEIWTHIQNLADDVDSDMNDTFGAAWDDFSSSLSWTAGTTSPTKGSGTTYSARSMLLGDHTCVDVVRINIGSGFSAGSGTYFFSPSHTPAHAEGYGVMSAAWFFDSSGSVQFAGIVRVTTSKFVLSFPAQSGTTTNNTPIKAVDMSASFPVVPASSDEIRFSMMYEV